MPAVEFLLILMLSDGLQAVADKPLASMADCTATAKRVIAANADLPWDSTPYVCVSRRRGSTETELTKFLRGPL